MRLKSKKATLSSLARKELLVECLPHSGSPEVIFTSSLFFTSPWKKDDEKIFISREYIKKIFPELLLIFYFRFMARERSKNTKGMS
jgi:hypothetical protein